MQEQLGLVKWYSVMGLTRSSLTLEWWGLLGQAWEGGDYMVRLTGPRGKVGYISSKLRGLI